MQGKPSILIAVVVIIAVVILAKDFIIKIVAEQSVRAVTGLPLRIDNLRMGLTTSLIDIKGLRLYNPAGFEDKVMIKIPEIYVDYKLMSIFKGVIEVSDLRLHLEEFMVVKNKKGEVNIEQLKALQQQKAEKTGAPQEKAKQDIRINKLALKIDKIIYKDYSKEGEPSVKEFKIGIDQTYEGIDNLNALVSLIVVRSLAQTTIANLTNVDISGLSNAVSGTLKGATETTKKVIGETTDTTKKIIGETTENVKDLLKNPFGK
ncbi:MAG TPA: AsmA family protein [Candidatus Omnitrophota bacterium]|nr:AsmA family protein [Candidatus Omnitrophota bacterium]